MAIPPCAPATAVALMTLPVTHAHLKELGVEAAPQDDNEEGGEARCVRWAQPPSRVVATPLLPRPPPPPTSADAV